MDGVAKGIENGGRRPDRSRRCGSQTLVIGNDNVLGKGAWTIDADSFGVLHKMSAAGQAVAAAPANDVPFATDDVAWMKVRHVGADFHDFAHEFVPHHHWNRDRLLSPSVPVVDVNVRAANARPIHFDQHIVDADGGFGDVF